MKQRTRLSITARIASEAEREQVSELIDSLQHQRPRQGKHRQGISGLRELLAYIVIQGILEFEGRFTSRKRERERERVWTSASVFILGPEVLYMYMYCTYAGEIKKITCMHSCSRAREETAGRLD